MIIVHVDIPDEKSTESFLVDHVFIIAKMHNEEHTLTYIQGNISTSDMAGQLELLEEIIAKYRDQYPALRKLHELLKRRKLESED